MTFNDKTFLVGIFFLPLWFLWEMLTFWLRSKGYFGGPIPGRGNMTVGTISMVMQHRAYQLNALPFFWSGMMAHWWFNWFGTKTWDVPYPTIAWWSWLTITFAMDLWLWNTPYPTLHPWLKFYRAPMMQCVVGFATAYFLFPQQMPRLPGWRWW